MNPTCVNWTSPRPWICNEVPSSCTTRTTAQRKSTIPTRLTLCLSASVLTRHGPGSVAKTIWPVRHRGEIWTRVNSWSVRTMCQPVQDLRMRNNRWFMIGRCLHTNRAFPRVSTHLVWRHLYCVMSYKHTHIHFRHTHTIYTHIYNIHTHIHTDEHTWLISHLNFWECLMNIYLQSTRQ